MNEKLQTIFNVVEQSGKFSEEEKNIINKSLKETDREIAIAAFKIERLEKVKTTTTVLLEQTIEELEQKRKAVEMQNRELEIEAALERVRARTMAMQSSDELSETAYILFQQFKQLGEDPIQITIGIFDEEKNNIEFRITGGDGTGSRIDQTFIASIDEPTLIHKVYTAWKQNLKSVMIELSGKELSDWIKYRNQISGIYAYETKINDDDRRYAAAAFFSKGMLSVSKTNVLSEETIQILEKFASVFDLTYTRLTDLKKAEAQAREATIEAALERVRAKAMAMQTSNELNGLIATVFAELKKLDLVLTRSVIIIYEGNENGVRWWMANSEIPSNPMNFFVKYADMPFFNEYLKGWQERTLKWQYILEGENKITTDEFLFHETELSQLPEFVIAGMKAPERVYLNASFNNFGNLTLASLEPLSNEHSDILLRFAKVFDLTYTRFNDLKQAEAQAKESQIEIALERVRSRTLAMQKSDELAETAAVLFRQLINLGIEPNRLYINIIKDENANSEFWITDEDGNKVSSAFLANLSDNPTFQKMYQGWREKKRSLSIDMQGEELQEYFNYLSLIHVPFKGGLAQKRRVQHVAYFSKGFIGIAAPEEQSHETLELLERFAYVFNLTFTRFNDLKMAEAHALQAEQDLLEIKAARKKAEEALSELQATQKQLLQSEKMASLGELTAGIAHEIQNPLNFVNNFSEVSNELLDEMKTELEKGDTEEAKAIAEDIKQNLEKINHHGKRADAIVKGMLQHSRSSSGKKELTDINALCDEYLRLSYHGLRAKDKTFNAKFEMNADNTIGKINIIPQDIGRVILNLINNAFYAVNEKKQKLNGTYEPTVIVSIRKISGKIELRVIDNGNGISQKELGKIFQPFFTTKPTGQGTGLGLSLSYDIIKAHSGEIKVETKEGEGSIFIIQLPVNTN